MVKMIDDASNPNNLEALLPHFGLKQFRPGQREVISTVLSGRDCLCVMPTGGGKSLCYQLPALAHGGLTLVVSPLIALMKDQVDQLQRLNLPVTFINSTLSTQELFDRIDEMAAGRYRLVYVVPERFRSRRFVEAARHAGVRLFAIDEAHCISEWGHDFRPDYARLGQFRQMLGGPPTIALTATATDQVRKDIIAKLALREPAVFVRGFERPNLFYRVERPTNERDKNQRLLALLQSASGDGIIYTSSRRRAEDVADFLSSQTKRRVVVYHAGLLPEQRKAAQESFMRGQAEIVVATNAFGMGIDKPDVRFVIHYNMPGTLEGYYQEAGRAGRDGLPSECLMLYHRSDQRILEYFIESAHPSPDVVAEVWNLLRAIEDDPIEMTQQEIKQRLGLPVGPDGVGACEELLEEAGAIERLLASENRASVRLATDLPTLVDMVPAKAVRRRSVLQAVERLVGARRHEQVFFRPEELVKLTRLEPATLRGSLRELNRLQGFTYVPPFRGRAIRVLQHNVPFEALKIDFKQRELRKAAEYEKMRRVLRFVDSSTCRQREILEYFGEDDTTECGHCDNCHRNGARSSNGVTAALTDRSTSADTAPAIDPEQVATRVRMALAGVARARRQCPCGKRLVAQMLCGSEASTVKRLGFHKLSTFGLLRDMRQNEVVDLLDALIACGFLKQTETQPHRPIVELTSAGTRYMRRDSAVESPPLPTELASLYSRAARSRADESPESGVSPEGGALHASDGTGADRCGGESEPASLEPVHPRHYWTWRLLQSGFDLDACRAIRRMTLDDLLDDVARIEDQGLPFRLDLILSAEAIAELDRRTAGGAAVEIGELMGQLPGAVRYEAVQLYLTRKGRGASA